jgi:hypothetical protein
MRGRPRAPGRTGLLALAAAALLALGVAYVLRDTPGYLDRPIDGRWRGDIYHYVLWTRLVTLGGLQAAYHGTWPETYAVYGPVVLYAYQAVGTAYRLLVDPELDPLRAEAGTWLPRALKGVAVLWHLATAGAIYGLLRRGPPGAAARAAPAAALYLANPATLFAVAHWAQPDGAPALFGVLAVGWLSTGRPAAGGAALALAALAKPQAWALFPLASLAAWRTRGARGLAAAAGGAVVAGAAAVLPLLLAGRLDDLLTLPGVVASLMPVVTANGHNLWWIVAAARLTDPLLIPDTAAAIGPLTYRTVAGALVGAQFAFACWLYLSRRAALAEAAALGFTGWFVFTTQAHENHLLPALALLALAWPERPRLLPVFGVLTATAFLNMALHDRLLLEVLGLTDPGLVAKLLRTALRTANALVIVLVFAAWAAGAARRRPPSPEPATLPERPRGWRVLAAPRPGPTA